MRLLLLLLQSSAAAHRPCVINITEGGGKLAGMVFYKHKTPLGLENTQKHRNLYAEIFIYWL
jgi:hypothetical protein